MHEANNTCRILLIKSERIQSPYVVKLEGNGPKDQRAAYTIFTSHNLSTILLKFRKIHGSLPQLLLLLRPSKGDPLTC